jgi:hypothetical protein
VLGPGWTEKKKKTKRQKKNKTITRKTKKTITRKTEKRQKIFL